MQRPAYFPLSKYFTGIDTAQVRALFRLLAVSLAGLHVWAAMPSQSMNPDGISYLDIGDAYIRADWAHAINPVWSPFYSLILGLVNFIFRPSMSWQFPTVHIVNFAIYVAAMFSFEFMWRGVRPGDADRGSQPIPKWLWWAFGYLLFIWTSLSLIQIWSVTPDMLMAAFLFLAAGLIARIRFGETGSRRFIQLGLVLGLGYLSKTFMFVIAWVCLAIVALIVWHSKNFVSKLLLAVGAFLLVVLPFIALVSEAKGRLSIGEVGKLTYARYVMGVPYPHWQGDPARGITLTHPSRPIHRAPPVYEFGGPVGGTYPISTDPSYWYDGLTIAFEPRGLLARLLASSLYYLDLFGQKQGVLIAWALALYLMRPRQRLEFAEVARKWALVILALVAFGLYAAVWVEGRYVGAFAVLFWADILANSPQLDKADQTRSLRYLGVLAALGLLANILAFNLDGFIRVDPALHAANAAQVEQPAKPLDVASALLDMGIVRDDRVGVIGDGFNAFWARLAGVKIVAELLDSDATGFWQGDETLRSDVLQAFASTGAEAVIAEKVPAYARLQGWHRVGNGNYYIYLFGNK